MWQVYKDGGRPWPVLDEDDVIDYMVMEAVAIKVRDEERRAQKEAKRKQETEQARQRLVKDFG